MNKNDLRAQWEIGPEDLASLGWTTYASSAKTGEGVEEMFQTLAGQMLVRQGPRGLDDDDEE